MSSFRDFFSFYLDVHTISIIMMLRGGSMVRRYVGLTILCGIFSVLMALPEVFIENDDLPFVIGTYALYDQNASIFQWDEFDSTRLWWDLTGYPGGRSARVHLLNPSSGLPPAPDTFPNAEVLVPVTPYL